MAQSIRTEPHIALTEQHISDFLRHLTDKGCQISSVKKYRRDLARFYDMLPEGKEIHRGTVSAWRAALVDRGYAPRTVNANVAEAAQLVGQYEIVTAQVAEKALPACNITFIEGAEMQEKLSGYLSVLLEQNPQSVGGELPGDDFYYTR